MIRKLRTSQGLSLRHVADALGISESFLSQIENKKRKPSAKLLNATAAFFHCNSDELAVSVGVIPNWMMESIMASPVEAMKCCKDGFKKYE
jgi:transcriptional regulator with XRE-family HTH domain